MEDKDVKLLERLLLEIKEQMQKSLNLLVVIAILLTIGDTMMVSREMMKLYSIPNLKPENIQNLNQSRVSENANRLE